MNELWLTDEELMALQKSLSVSMFMGKLRDERNELFFVATKVGAIINSKTPEDGKKTKTD